MRKGDYAKAYCIWNELAEDGIPEAQFSLGWMYHNGYGLLIDNQETRYWWGEAASKGLANAAFALGMFLSQEDEFEDLPAAVEYYLQADQAGNPDARPMLGHLLAKRGGDMKEIMEAWGAEEWRTMATPIRVKVPKANVRSGPSTDHELLESFTKGEKLLQLFGKGGWLRAMHPEDGRMFWIYARLVETDST